MPPCDHTGTPRHFTSSTTSGSACLMRARTRASTSPRQSPSSAMRASMSCAGESLPLLSPVVAAFFIGPSQPLAGQLAGLLHPVDELRLKLVALADVEVAHFRMLGRAGRHGTERGATEEGHLHVVREAMVAEEPALPLAAVEGRVPLHRLLNARNAAFDERVEAAPDVPLP